MITAVTLCSLALSSLHSIILPIAAETEPKYFLAVDSVRTTVLGSFSAVFKFPVRAENVNLKRLGSILALAHETKPADFESLLMLDGVGPRTLQSLTLVSEVIHGTPSRFEDPARFSFAHGGKDGHPFPVPLKIYDNTISTLKQVKMVSPNILTKLA